MALKNFYPALATTSLVRESCRFEHILHLRRDDFSNLEKLPEDLLLELQAFTERNSLAVIASCISDREGLHYCCPQCFKAFLIKRAGEIGIDKEIVKWLSEKIECEPGHEGYFIDRDELFKV